MWIGLGRDGIYFQQVKKLEIFWKHLQPFKKDSLNAKHILIPQQRQFLNESLICSEMTFLKLLKLFFFQVTRKRNPESLTVGYEEFNLKIGKEIKNWKCICYHLIYFKRHDLLSQGKQDALCQNSENVGRHSHWLSEARPTVNRDPARTTFQKAPSEGKDAHLSKSKAQAGKHFGYSWVIVKERVNPLCFQLPWKSCSQIISKCNLLFWGWKVGDQRIRSKALQMLEYT